MYSIENESGLPGTAAETLPVGLVLEGVGQRGVFTAGVLDFLAGKNLVFSYAVGCAAGAYNLLGYVSGQIGRVKDCVIQKTGSRLSGIGSIPRRGKSDETMIDLNHFLDRFLRDKTDRYDFKAFFHSPTESELVATNCETGEAEYLTERRDASRLLRALRAASSMPLFSDVARLDDGVYMDGSASDCIPIRRAEEKGFRKNIVVLTRAKGCFPVTTSYQKMLYDSMYKKYPKFLEALGSRRKNYLSALSYVEEQEKSGSIFVIRPKGPEIRQLETSPDILTGYYNAGYRAAEESWPALQAFLGDETSGPQEKVSRGERILKTLKESLGGQD